MKEPDTRLLDNLAEQLRSGPDVCVRLGQVCDDVLAETVALGFIRRSRHAVLDQQLWGAKPWVSQTMQLKDPARDESLEVCVRFGLLERGGWAVDIRANMEGAWQPGTRAIAHARLARASKSETTSEHYYRGSSMVGHERDIGLPEFCSNFAAFLNSELAL